LPAANDVGLRPMMTATLNDAWLRHILGQTSHHCGTKWSNIILSEAKNIISPQAHIISRRLHCLRLDEIQHFVLMIYRNKLRMIYKASP